MRAYNFASGIDLATTADGDAVSIQSSLISPAVYIKGVGPQVVVVTDGSTEAIFTAADVGIPDGSPVTLDGTAAPTGFVFGTTYYAVGADVGAKTFNLSLTKGGAAIDYTAAGTAVTAQAMVNYGTGPETAGGFDEDAKPGFQFTPGNSVVVAIQSAADHAGTSVSLQGADPSANDPTIAGSYTTLATVAGISTATQLFNVVLKQFLRWSVTADAAEGADVASITLLCQ